jgi:hypothetical protein
MANKRTILIVDDDAELRDALVEQLAGPRVFTRPKTAKSIW